MHRDRKCKLNCTSVTVTVCLRVCVIIASVAATDSSDCCDVISSGGRRLLADSIQHTLPLSTFALFMHMAYAMWLASSLFWLRHAAAFSRRVASRNMQIRFCRLSNVQTNGTHNYGLSVVCVGTALCHAFVIDRLVVFGFDFRRYNRRATSSTDLLCLRRWRWTVFSRMLLLHWGKNNIQQICECEKISN